MTEALLALAAYHEKECCRYVNGCCMTLRCQRRGGYIVGTIPDYEKATCEAHETAVILRDLAKPYRDALDQPTSEKPFRDLDRRISDDEVDSWHS